MTAKRDAERSDGGAVFDVSRTVYSNLRAIAQNKMNGERAGHVLTATALVHEAVLRLREHPQAGGAERGASPEQRLAFLRAAGEAMRRVLIEHARMRDRTKRGGGRKCVPDFDLNALADVSDLSSDDRIEMATAFNEAFQRLEEHGPRLADVVRLRFYVGLSIAECASVLGVSERSVNNDWTYARAWLARSLNLHREQ